MTTAAEPVEPKAVRSGTHRACSPEETMARVGPLMAGLGITRVADVTRLDDIGIPVFQAVRPKSRNLSVSQGKGVTRELAMVSAVMESVEGRAAEEVPVAVPRARQADLPIRLGYPLACLARARYAEAAAAAELDWAAAVSLVTGGPTLVPAAAVSLDWTRRERWRPRMFDSNSNGLASGNSWSEAVLHGCYELVERDAVFGGGRGRQIALDSVTAPETARMIEQILSAGNRLTLRFYPHKTGLPAFSARITNEILPHDFAGFGCHLDTDIALSRAITEAAQSRLTEIAGSRDDIRARDYFRSRPVSAKSFADDPELFSMDDIGTRSASDDLAEDLGTVVSLVSSNYQWDPLAVDLALGPGVHVVKVIQPGVQWNGGDLSW